MFSKITGGRRWRHQNREKLYIHMTTFMSLLFIHRAMYPSLGGSSCKALLLSIIQGEISQQKQYLIAIYRLYTMARSVVNGKTMWAWAVIKPRKRTYIMAVTRDSVVKQR